MSANRYSRRRLVASAGALAALPVIGRAAGPRLDVVVVGAGLAGLNAALLLEEQGYRVQVLEAGSGPGGRVQTRSIGGRLQELGASDVGANYGRVLDQLARRGLETVPWDIRVRPFAYHVNGQLVSAADWASAIANQPVGDERSILPALLEQRLIAARNPLAQADDWLQPEFARLDVSVDDWLAAGGASPEARRLVGATFLLSDTRATSTLSVLRDLTIQKLVPRAADGHAMAMRQIAGGNQRLPQAMAAALKTPLATGCAVTAVTATAAGVELRTTDGRRWQARRAVLAVPLTALRRIAITPVLPPLQAEAIRELGYARTSKFYLRATAPFWQADGLDASLWTDTELERVFALEEPDGQVRNLLVWLNRTAAPFDRLQGAAAHAHLLRRLAELRPATAGKLEVIGEHSWLATPGIEGCIQRYGPGQVARYAAVLPEPHGPVHFAGEHTRRVDVGMEAAMASGERAALEILAAA
jgi:monoamine oxidase